MHSGWNSFRRGKRKREEKKKKKKRKMWRPLFSLIYLWAIPRSEINTVIKFFWFQFRKAVQIILLQISVQPPCHEGKSVSPFTLEPHLLRTHRTKRAWKIASGCWGFCRSSCCVHKPGYHIYYDTNSLRDTEISTNDLKHAMR